MCFCLDLVLSPTIRAVRWRFRPQAVDRVARWAHAVEAQPLWTLAGLSGAWPSSLDPRNDLRLMIRHPHQILVDRRSYAVGPDDQRGRVWLVVPEGGAVARQ